MCEDNDSSPPIVTRIPGASLYWRMGVKMNALEHTMKLSPLAALILLGCGSTASTATSTAPATTSDDTSVGSATEALRQIGKNDTDVVQSCQDLVQKCNEHAADSGAAGICDKLATHCAELDAQLAAVRAKIEDCLTKAAACEQSKGGDAGACSAAREACAPEDKDFEARRGQTLQCASHAQSCLERGHADFGFGRGAAEASDAGAACDDNGLDFVGCCRGGFGHEQGDAGLRGMTPPPPARGGLLGNRAPGAGAGMLGGMFGGRPPQADGDAGVAGENRDRGNKGAEPAAPVHH